jgi:hypothetical protein
MYIHICIYILRNIYFKVYICSFMYIYRCISLGADGEVILWNTLTKDYGKIGERKIHSLDFDDH